MRPVSFGISLMILWLLLSGYFTPMLVGLGVASCLLVVFITRHMEVIDHEGHPTHLLKGLITYVPWLMKEIIKSNWDVGKIILSRQMQISPNMIHVKPTQHNELGVMIFANSITLTPGTVTVSVEDSGLSVHGLTIEASESVLEGEMNRRVTRLEE